MNRYTLSAYKHVAALIKGVQSLGLNMNMRQIIASGSGAVDPSFVGVGEIAPEITFDTTAIKTALANCGGADGDALSNDIFFLQKLLDGGLRGGAATHVKLTAATGIIIPTQIRAAQGGEATIGYRALPTSADGEAAPIALLAGQSLEVGQSVVSEIYTLGPVSINGTPLEGVDDITIDFGITLTDKRSGSGAVYPTFIGIMKREPVITVRTFDLDAFVSWGLDGVAQGETDSTVQLLDQLAGGVRGSSPITFTFDAGMIHCDTVDGTHGQQSSGSVKITPVWDGVADIIVISGLT